MRTIVSLSLILLLVMCGLTGSALARGNHGDPCKSFLGSVLNDCVGHPTEKKETEVGLGLDIPLWKNDKVIVDQETKVDLHDGANDPEWATYTVVKPQLEKGIFQTLGDWIGDLVKKVKGDSVEE